MRLFPLRRRARTAWLSGHAFRACQECGLFIDEKGALALGLGPGLLADTDEENLLFPTVQDRLRQSRNAKRGLALLVIGFGLQIVAAWPT